MRAFLLVSAALVLTPAAYAQTASNYQDALRGATADMSVETDSAYDVGAASVAGGNAYAAFGQNIDLDNTQHAQGAQATTTVSAGSAGGAVVATSAAVQNGVTAAAQDGAMDVRSTQTSSGGASADTLAETGYAGASATSATASGNVAALAADNADIRADLHQTNTGTTFARTDASHWAVGDQAVGGAIASANNITASGSTTTLRTASTQASHGDSVTAEVQLYAGEAWDAVGDAAANGNALTIANEFGYVNTQAAQANSATIDSRSYVTLGGDFAGFASASAYGVGNQVDVSNTSSDTDIDTVQTNSGDIYANAGLVAGGAGDQALASAAAYGNAVTGALCGNCGAEGDLTLRANNSQVNDGAVQAGAVIRARQANSIAGSATAIGNAASYQITNTGS